jgi:putative transposase
MTRIARVVIVGLPHHVIMRGHRRQKVFFKNEDRHLYLGLLRKHGQKDGLEYWAYCLMDNHVHLIAVPLYSDSFRRGLGVAHWKYSLLINLQHDWKGFLWQSRYKSYPMDDLHLLAAARYIELNPVRAEIVRRAEDYPWSSAGFHLFGVPDGLATRGRLEELVDDWASFLAKGTPEAERRLLRKHAETGRPLGDDAFLDHLERLTGRILREKRRGRKKKP